jgi:hypothetical protein
MALKGPLWLLGKALTEERNRTALAHLSSKALDLGLRKKDSTRGHMFQAIGAIQQFLIAHLQHKGTIVAASPFQPYEPAGQVLKDWKAFLQNHSGTYGNAKFGFGYDYDTLKGYLTKKYGGTRTGGGGGNNEFEICLRLAAAFMN